jgi:C4-dicarboxylate transporter DctQ subunit
VTALTRFIGRLEEALLAALLVAMALVTFIQIVLRYVFNTGFTWAQEATTYLFAWLVLLGISYGVKMKTHIGVDVWVKKMSPRAQRVAGIAAAGICVAYGALLLIASLRYESVMVTLGIEAEDISVPRWVFLLSLPVGFSLLLLRYALAAWGILAGKEKGVLLADEAAETIKGMRQDLPSGHGRTR